jgi:hypothetical protein
MEVVGHDATDLGYVTLAHTSERPYEVNHLIVASEPIQHVLSASFCIHKARAPKDLQVARGVGEAQVGPRGKLLDTAHALGDVFQQFQPVGVAKCLGHVSQAGKNRSFRSGA